MLKAWINVSNVAGLNFVIRFKIYFFSFLANDLLTVSGGVLTVSGEYYYLLLLSALW